MREAAAVGEDVASSVITVAGRAGRGRRHVGRPPRPFPSGRSWRSRQWEPRSRSPHGSLEGVGASNSMLYIIRKLNSADFSYVLFSKIHRWPFLEIGILSQTASLSFGRRWRQS